MLVHPQETSVMDDTDLHGEKLPPPRKKRADPSSEPKRHRPNALERATEKRLDRSAAYYEHVAPPAHRHETKWRHAAWQAKREVVRQTLERTGASTQALSNFDACGSTAVACWSPSLGRRRLQAYYCHCRHCEPCARAKANKITANLRTRLQHARRHEYRLVTLTMKHSTAPLADQVKRLYKCFKKLRQTKEWKSSQEGGAFMLEVKRNGPFWHPHLHGVVQGSFINKFTLSQLWHKVTGDSFIVDVRKIDRAEDAAHYVSKYITKGTSDSVWQSDSAAQEYVLATKGLRTCNTFGSWRKYPLLKVENDPKDWQIEDTLVNLLRRSAAGDQVANDILKTLKPDWAWHEADYPADGPPRPALNASG